MRYRVIFSKRLQADGTASASNPSAELDLNLADGVVADKLFVEQFESDAQHSQEVLDEDDGFLASAVPEVWEYDVVDDREQEFLEAMQNSGTVMEFSVVDETSTEAADAASPSLDDGLNTAPDAVDLTTDQPLSRSSTTAGQDH